MKAARTGHNVGLLDNFAKSAEIGQKECTGGRDIHGAETNPGAGGQFHEYEPHGSTQRSIALLEKTEKPIRRQPEE